jgi:hypothetical protein
VNLITHPKPQKAADFYTRLEMQWEGRVAGTEEPKEEPRQWDDGDGAMLVTTTGLEGANSFVVIDLYAFPGDTTPSVTRPLDGPDASDSSGLPSPPMEKAERVASLRSAPPRPTRG